MEDTIELTLGERPVLRVRLTYPRFTHCHATSEYSWWEEPPSGWKPLARIAEQLIALSGRRIPSTAY